MVGVVLAGGDATRFGDGNADKATARVGDRTGLERVVVAATSAPPVVAVRTPDQREAYAAVLGDRDVAFVFDDPAFEGPLAGMLGASATAPSVASSEESADAGGTASRSGEPWLFCCGCDMPLLSPAAVRWLRRELRAHRRCGGDSPAALAPRHADGLLDPLHALYRVSALADARERLPRATGPRRVLELLDGVVSVPAESAPERVSIEASTTNVTTVAEFEAVCRRPRIRD